MYTSKDGEGASSRMWERRRENLAAFHARKAQGLPPLTKHGWPYSDQAGNLLEKKTDDKV